MKGFTSRDIAALAKRIPSVARQDFAEYARRNARVRAVRADALQGKADSLKPRELVVTIDGLRILSNPNLRLHWAQRAKLTRTQRDAVRYAFAGKVLPALPVDVRMVRVYAGRQRELDSDNCVAGAKAARDAIADLYGIGDGDESRIRFTVGQERGERVGVRVEISTRREQKQ